MNQVFSQIMSVEFGEMDYTEKEKLIAGKEDDNDSEPAAEINIIDISAAESDEDGESIAKIQAEARFIAEKIKELTSGATANEGDSQHSKPDSQPSELINPHSKQKYNYSDIAILLRSIQSKAWQYAAALAEYGIPSDLPGGEGYFETIEVSAALSLLSVIDNPRQDIPLAAALRGPVYGFTADELATIRADSPKTDYYEALVKAAEKCDKCARFLH